MLAVAERAGGIGNDTEPVIWHIPVGDSVEAMFQAIACSAEEGIVLHGPSRDVPLQLNSPGEEWCDACLAKNRPA
jgi:hypothetical protein